MALARPNIGAPGPSAPSISPIKYDAFLSFHGEDVRPGFVSRLYSVLCRKGIVTFMDEDVGRGENISVQILQAIEQSQFAIIVFSENYFFSTWCLDELMEIMESKYNEGGTIIPVFFNIDPGDVQHHRRSIAAAFRKHDAKFSVDKVGIWREALTMIGSLSGWDTRNRNEAEIVEGISEIVWNKLYYKLGSTYDHSVGDIFDNLVGDIQSKVDKIISLSKIGLDDISFVGICGVGGVGKTTLSQCVYEAVHSKFEASCFLRNIREVSERHGLVYLQRMLLFHLGLGRINIDDPFVGGHLIRQFCCEKKVLIILDDVNHTSQLEKLAGSEDWFGMGSKIIITTRDESLLKVYKMFEVYEVGTLDLDESLELFCQKAFKKNEPQQGYLTLSKDIIGYAGGVPLRLVVMGSYLYGRTQYEWRAALDKCRKYLHSENFSIFHISYNGLDHECRMIFLDIACFFNGWKKFEVRNILETCYAYSYPPIKYGIEFLIAKSLLSFTRSNSNSRHNTEEDQDVHDRLQKMRRHIFLPTYMYNKLLHEASQESLHMHNVLQEMGCEFVRNESPSDPSRRSRLWDIEDIDHVLKGNEGTINVEGIVLDLRHPFKANWNPECFAKMRKLRLLDLSRVELAHNLICLPRELKFLRWDCYALESLPPFDELQELESLELRSSNVKRLWDGAPVLHKLRTVDLSNSDYLRETPDFSGTPNLEKLLFNYCDNLIQVHESVGQLKKLVELSLRFCKNLEALPSFLDMNNLEVFILSECSKLVKLPEFSKNMRRLYLLDVMNTEITEIPFSIINLESLKYIDVSGCRKLKSMPELPPKSIIRVNKDPFLASTLDLLLLIESRLSKYPSVAKDPIHIVIESKGKEQIPPWFEQQELRHSKDESGEVITITTDIPGDLANSEGEWLGIAVCIIFECSSVEAWRGFTINWEFQDYPHAKDKKGGQPHRTHENAGSLVDSMDSHAEIECRVYKGFFPIDKEKCRQHPCGVGGQVDLTLSFPTTNTIGKVIIHSKETIFGDMEIVGCGWRLVCKNEFYANRARISSHIAMAGADIGASSPSVVSTSSTSTYPADQPIYDVFLSFRGADRRKTFPDNLYAALERKGIVTFRDDEETERGDAISEKLIKAIQQSRHSIIVLSQQFASSTWCLEELQQILETKPKQTVFPVFYGVQPGDIERQRGKVAKAFAKLQRRYSNAKIKKWRAALSKVAKFSDWSNRDKNEAKLVEEIATHIWKKLGDHEMASNFAHLVGDVKSKVDWIISLLKMESNDTCFIGIWGESGIGKTTLARLVYDEIQSKFEATCFLDNVREDTERVGLVSLQKKLISELGLGERDIDDFSQGAEIIRNFLRYKKVLIILDDVSERIQLEYLAGNKEWFGAASKIVITTRDISSLKFNEQFEEFQVERLHPDESLKLLCLEAFKKDEPKQVYFDFSEELIKYACGLPLVLKVLGSYLCNKDEYEWKDSLEILRRNSTNAISSQLRICYDGLEDDEYKRIFLDIACFFNKEPKFKVTNILKLCDLHSTSGIKVLIEKSMLKVTRPNSDLKQNANEDQDMLDRIQKMRRDIFLPTYLYDWLLQEASKEYLDMHDLVQEMGRNIVFQESPINAGGRSRLWSLEDIDLVLKENKGTQQVQSIVLRTQEGFEADWDPNCFSKMANLRLLMVLSKVNLLRKLESLPTALKSLRWDYYAEDCLPSIAKFWNLESLQLCNSNIRKLWEGIPSSLNKLSIIDASHSECLSETPDFRGTPNLEVLLLNGCRNLVHIHESVGQLKKLVMLSLKDCTRLESFPLIFETDNLAEFILSGCLKLEKLPDFSENMRSLYFFDVRGTDITEIPRSIIHLTNLNYLDLTFCSRLKSIPELPPNVIIYASNCSLLEPTSALRYLYASCAPKGPIHLLYDFQLWTRIPTWFERWEYCWGKDTSGEFVTITADIPSNVMDYERQCWGIVVCVVFQFLSQAWLGFSIKWNFEDKSHPKKTKIHGTPAYYMHDCRVYVGFYPFEPKDCRQHASGEGSQLDLTLEFPATNIIKGFHDLEIMECGWRLACKKDFDAWNESKAPSPPRLGFLKREKSNNNSITERKGKRKKVARN